MTTKWEFTVHGKPVPKGRPRIVTKGKFPRAYTPARTMEHEKKVALAALECFPNPVAGPVHVSVDAYWPARNPRKRNPRKQCWRDCGADLDNVVKAVLDGMNGIAYLDDKQVVSLSARKWYADQSEEARTDVRIELLDGQE